MEYLNINLVKNFDKSLPLRIGTLGPAGTSSEQAAIHFLENSLKPAYPADIVLFDTFDDVLDSLVASEVSLAIIPNAYERVNEFYINPHTELVEVFIYDTPSYGLAKKPHNSFGDCKIVTHPAPINLVNFLLKKIDKKAFKYSVELVNSTSVAAKMVKEGVADLAITNAMAAAKHGLEMIAMYGPIKMSWSVFIKREEKF